MTKEEILSKLDRAITSLREFPSPGDPEILAKAFEAIRDYVQQMHQSITITPKDSKRVSKRVSKPQDWGEVWQYIAVDLGMSDDDVRYIWNNWLANGFTRNGKPILDWKAAARAWKAGHFYPSQRQK